MSEATVSIRVWGDLACFTRPEMKVERVSYPVITPSAARGILEAIFWEPQIFYVLEAVRIVRKGRWVSFRRNEVTARVSVESAKAWMKAPETFSPTQADKTEKPAIRAQRNMLALAEVEYILTARVALSALGAKGQHNLKTYCDEIERRAKKGKCFHRPAMGMREFAADFEWEPDPQAALERRASELRPDRSWQQIWPEEDLGLMLYDVFDHRQRTAGFRWFTDEEKSQAQTAVIASAKQSGKRPKKSNDREAPRFEGILVQPQAAFFYARVKDACMDCDPQRVKMIIKPLEAGYAA